MCDDHIGLCPHTPGGDPHEPADAPAAQSQSDALAKHILNGLGFCGHFLHFHGGGASGKAPSSACSPSSQTARCHSRN